MDPKNTRPASDSLPGESFGLVANGSADGWDVEIDESITGAERWFLQIEGPAVYFRLRIDGPKVVDRLLEFLDARLGSGLPGESGSSGEGEVPIGKVGRTDAQLTWDPEGEGHCLVSISNAGELTVQIRIIRKDAEALRSALLQVRADLCAEGFVGLPISELTTSKLGEPIAPIAPSSSGRGPG